MKLITSKFTPGNNSSTCYQCIGEAQFPVAQEVLWYLEVTIIIACAETQTSFPVELYIHVPVTDKIHNHVRWWFVYFIWYFIYFTFIYLLSVCIIHTNYSYKCNRMFGFLTLSWHLWQPRSLWLQSMPEWSHLYRELSGCRWLSHRWPWLHLRVSRCCLSLSERGEVYPNPRDMWLHLWLWILILRSHL